MLKQVPVYIKEVGIVDFKGFRGEHKFSFVDDNGDWCRWTVFLGNNNAGKTNLLKAIASLEPEATFSNIFYPKVFTQDSYRNKIAQGTQLGLSVISTLTPSNNEFSNEFVNKFDLGFSKSSETILQHPKGIHNTHVASNLQIYAYGVVREIEKKGISEKKMNDSNTDNLFDNTKLVNFEDWLFQLDYAAKNRQEKAAQQRDILKTVITSEIFPAINNLKFISDEKLNNYIEFQTVDGWHKMSELGYGYQATLSWMADFCKKMFDRYPDSKNPLKEPAVLLIDEIDLHLHPQWQRGLIKSLSGIFPQTQFIVTTHSPFIIQSMENVNLYTLNRVGDHTEVKHLGNKSYIGWKIEEILSEVMGLEENINTDKYQELINQFDKALDTDDYAKGKAAYDQLMQILHPQSAERKLLDIQFSQLSPDNDKA